MFPGCSRKRTQYPAVNSYEEIVADNLAGHSGLPLARLVVCGCA